MTHVYLYTHIDFLILRMYKIRPAKITREINSATASRKVGKLRFLHYPSSLSLHEVKPTRMRTLDGKSNTYTKHAASSIYVYIKKTPR